MVYSGASDDLTLTDPRGPFLILAEKPTLPPPLLAAPVLEEEVKSDLQRFKNAAQHEMLESDVSYLDNLIKG